MSNSILKKAIIPVAGLGTRMLPATKAIPKEMLPVLNKPIIQYIIEEARFAGFEEIILITHSSKDSIENHFDKSFELEARLEKRLQRSLLKEIKEISKLRVSIQSVRQEEPKGLGHAILCAKPIIGKDPFGIILPDMLISRPDNKNGTSLKKMKSYFDKNNISCCLLGKAKRKDISKYGIAKISKSNKFSGSTFIKKIVEKPSLSKAPSNFFAAGRYIFKNELMNCLSKVKPNKNGEIELTDAINIYLDSCDEVLGVPLDGLVYDCGDKFEYLLANIDFAQKDKDLKAKLQKHLKRKLF